MVEGPSTVDSHFRDMAIRLDLEERDFAYLQYAGIYNMSEMFYKLPTQERLEQFILDELHEYTGYYEVDVRGLERPRWQPRYYTGDYRGAEEFVRGPEAKALRQLWDISKVEAKRDVAHMTGDKEAIDRPKILSMPMARLFEGRARTLGLDQIDDNQYPGPHCLNRVTQAYSPGKAPEYIYRLGVLHIQRGGDSSITTRPYRHCHEVQA